MSRLLVTFHQKSRSRGGSEWQGEMRAAGGMVLPLCHHIRPLNDSSWCQALGNTGNESHPRALAPAGAFRDGLAQERPGARGFSSVCGREGGGTLTPGTFFFRFGLVFFKSSLPTQNASSAGGVRTAGLDRTARAPPGPSGRRHSANIHSHRVSERSPGEHRAKPIAAIVSERTHRLSYSLPGKGLSELHIARFDPGGSV